LSPTNLTVSEPGFSSHYINDTVYNPVSDTLYLVDNGNLFAIRNISQTLFPGGVPAFPAGTAGEPIRLALSGTQNDAGTLTGVVIDGLPSGWQPNAGEENSDGTWLVAPSDLSTLGVTPPSDYTGAVMLTVTESFVQADGSPAATVIKDNIEAYAPGSPIFARAGDDTLTGAPGGDRFVFAQPIGRDVIYDFDPGSDQIDLIGFGNMNSFADVQASLTQDGNGNAVIMITNGETITLTGISAQSLSAQNFTFGEEPVTNNVGDITVSDAATLPLGGTINNSGTITLNSAGNGTELEMLGPRVTLTGGGRLTMSDSNGNIVSGTNAAVTLDNVDNTISGAGQLGNGQLTLINEAAGVIAAVGNNPLTLNSGSNAIVNSGTLRSDGGALVVLSAVTGVGEAVINNGAIEFGSASDANVSFANGASGTLKLDDSQSFTGQISGFGGQDAMDLADIAFSANTTLGYAANSDSSGGTLTVNDSSHSANLALLGSYMASSFATASDGHGGTLIAAGATQTPSSDAPVAPPHA
jgi:hypothetical protein